MMCIKSAEKILRFKDFLLHLLRNINSWNMDLTHDAIEYLSCCVSIHGDS